MQNVNFAIPVWDIVGPAPIANTTNLMPHLAYVKNFLSLNCFHNDV